MRKHLKHCQHCYQAQQVLFRVRSSERCDWQFICPDCLLSSKTIRDINMAALGEALILYIPAPYNLDADKQALQKESFEQRLEVVLASAAAEKHTNNRITTLKTLYQEAALQPEMSELQ